MGKNLAFECFSVFVIYAKSATLNNCWRDLSGITYSSPFSRGFNDFQKIVFFSLEKKSGLKFFIVFQRSLYRN